MKHLLIILFCFSALLGSAQDENIVKIIDDLTIQWDKRASDLGKYSGMKYYCTAEKYRNETIELLDKIHHYDTVLYQIVSEKYKDAKDKEAKATLKDILTVETEYTTPNFKSFLQQECDQFAAIGEKYSQESGSKYYDEIEKLEKELNKYVTNVTNRIDLIDEHVHHLKLD